MTDNLLFDFTVDKAAKTVYITREFAAQQSLVWDAFTKQEILDQWMAPAPWVSRTKYRNFEVGGKRLYAMVSPEGEERWSIQEYRSITPKTHFKMYNAFADKDENPELPGSEWDHHFSAQNARPPGRLHHSGGEEPVGRAITKVRITIFNESFDRMEKLLDGFRQGFTATLKNLENVLTTLSKQ